MSQLDLYGFYEHEFWSVIEADLERVNAFYSKTVADLVIGMAKYAPHAPQRRALSRAACACTPVLYCMRMHACPVLSVLCCPVVFCPVCACTPVLSCPAPCGVAFFLPSVSVSFFFFSVFFAMRVL